MENKSNSSELRDKCWYGEVCGNVCKSNCIRYLEMKYLMESSNLPKAKQRNIDLYPDECDYDTFIEIAHLKNDIVNFVNKGGNIYIASKTTGNGKTSWSIKLMLKYFDEVWAGNGFKPRALFIHVPTFLSQVKDFNNDQTQINQIKKMLPTIDLVVWDDIGSVDLSKYDLSQILTYLDTRILNEKANIYTGNLIGQDLEKNLGERLFSRMWHGSKHFIFVGNDKRGVNV